MARAPRDRLYAHRAPRVGFFCFCGLACCCRSWRCVPGLLQTAACMTGILTEVRQGRGVEVDDIAEAVAERAGQQRSYPPIAGRTLTPAS